MAGRSLYSCIMALAILSVYILLFGFTTEIGVDNSANLMPASEETNTVEEELPIDGREAEETTLYPPAITKYETGINASNYAKPGFADYPAQTTAPVYYEDTAEDETTAATEAQTAADTTAEATTVATTTAATTTVTTTTAATTTAATTTAATTTAATTTAATTAAATTTGTLSPDVSTLKLTVSDAGNIVTDSAFNIISRIVQKEIGSSFEAEAIKAQAVASYTFVKVYNDNNATPNVLLASVVSDRVSGIVKEVLGEAIYYNGDMIQALYCASSAGRTASSVNVWGADYPYLRGVETAFDSVYDPNYGLKKNITKDEMMITLIDKTGITPTGDPSSWLKVLNYVDEVYVGDMTISGKASYTSNGTEIMITGRVFRERIIGLSELKSAAFEFTYDASKEMFTFVTYGYGHGVGLSQNGANILARYHGYNYKDILKFYYQGTEIY